MFDPRELRHVSIFEDLTVEEIRLVTPLCSTARYAKGTTLFEEDRPATDLFVLQTGRIVIMMSGAQGHQTLVYSVEPGQAFSWSALVPPRKYTASAVAVESSETIVINGRKLAHLLKKNPALGYKVMCRIAQLISKRLRHTRLQLLNIHDWQTAESRTS